MSRASGPCNPAPWLSWPSRFPARTSSIGCSTGSAGSSRGPSRTVLVFEPDARAPQEARGVAGRQGGLRSRRPTMSKVRCRCSSAAGRLRGRRSRVAGIRRGPGRVCGVGPDRIRPVERGRPARSGTHRACVDAAFACEHVQPCSFARSRARSDGPLRPSRDSASCPSRSAKSCWTCISPISRLPVEEC